MAVNGSEFFRRWVVDNVSTAPNVFQWTYSVKIFYTAIIFNLNKMFKRLVEIRFPRSKQTVTIDDDARTSSDCFGNCVAEWMRSWTDFSWDNRNIAHKTFMRTCQMTFSAAHAILYVTIHGQNDWKFGMPVKDGIVFCMLHNFQMCRQFAGSGDGDAGGTIQRTRINGIFEFIQAASGLADIKGLAMAKWDVSKIWIDQTMFYG